MPDHARRLSGAELNELLHTRDLTSVTDFQLGPILVSPSRRLLEGPAGSRHLQPQVMLVLHCLLRHEGQVVTRSTLFELCWGGAAVGDDSLNRTLTGIRHVFEAVSPGAIAIETVPRTGYRLTRQTREAGGDSVVSAAYDCWRSGLPQADTQEIIELQRVLDGSIGDARAWGILALLHRKAAEYAGSEECASHVRGCEEAAHRALALQLNQSDALVALAGLPPLLGNWATARRQLLDVLAREPAHAPALHDLAIVEMTTGRTSAAVPIIEELIAKDPLAASFHYKRMYHLWTIGDINGAEQVAARATQLWPLHPAIWNSRFWILLFTERADQALRMVIKDCPPLIPPPAAAFLQVTAETVAARQGGATRAVSSHIARSLKLAASGPAQAVSALMALCALDAIDEAFEVAQGYYLGQGKTAAPLRWTAGGPSIMDQHRRVTQPLFIPSGKQMREDDRFMSLCDDIGLTAYWDEFALVPDFLVPSGGAPPAS